MRITLLGAAGGEVTGSAYLLQTADAIFGFPDAWRLRMRRSRWFATCTQSGKRVNNSRPPPIPPRWSSWMNLLGIRRSESLPRAGAIASVAQLPPLSP